MRWERGKAGLSCGFFFRGGGRNVLLVRRSGNLIESRVAGLDSCGLSKWSVTGMWMLRSGRIVETKARQRAQPRWLGMQCFGSECCAWEQ